MKILEKGQKISLEKDEIGKLFYINFDWNITSYDVFSSALLISNENKLENDFDFIYTGNPVSQNYEVIALEKPLAGYKDSFKIDLEKIHERYSKIVFVITIDSSAKLNHKFKDITGLRVILDDNIHLLEFKIEGLTDETSVIALEIYKRNNEWRIHAVGNGFNNGISVILKEYGNENIKIEKYKLLESFIKLEKADKSNEIINVEETKNEIPKSKSSISLSKITLEKKGESTKIDLTKRDNENNKIHINLNWKQNTNNKGFFKSLFNADKPLDLDLGCMFETKDHFKGVIQALGNAFGSKTDEPFIYLDKDDRSGASTDGENIYIIRPEILKRAVIFCYIYSGNRDFREAESYFKIKGFDQEITINLDNPSPGLTFCVAVLIENNNGTIKIEKVNEYVKSHKDCDRMYGFNFYWYTGSKN